jgi:hypothetical protein
MNSIDEEITGMDTIDENLAKTSADHTQQLVDDTHLALSSMIGSTISTTNILKRDIW